MVFILNIIGKSSKERMSMKSRERIHHALQHKEPDRVLSEMSGIGLWLLI